MLILKPSCENCNIALPADSTEAMVCSFECTFCRNCVETELDNTCPNCAGEFQQRPARVGEMLVKYPASTKVVFNPVADR